MELEAVHKYGYNALLDLMTCEEPCCAPKQRRDDSAGAAPQG